MEFQQFLLALLLPRSVTGDDDGNDDKVVDVVVGGPEYIFVVCVPNQVNLFL